MAADPKYADLPGIAYDQPDVFETNDLPEVDQDLALDYESDAVETLHISQNEAIAKFRLKHLDASDVDFSDRIRRSKRKGYIAWSGVFEVLAEQDKEKETPVQKYQRLNCEMRELLDELESLSVEGHSAQQAGGSGNRHLVDIAKQSSLLQKDLENIKLEQILGCELLRSLENPSNYTKDKLLAQLDALKNVPSVSKDAKSSDAQTSVLYELLMKPETCKLEEQQQIAKLERRLASLEKAIGATPETMSALCLETSQKSIFGSIQVLNSRLSLLDPSHLDHVEGRLAALLQRMSSVADRKQTLEEAEKQSKISELYDLVHQSEAMACLLPDIVDRLESLQALHEQAAYFAKTLSQLDSVQQKLQLSLANNQKILDETKNKFVENVDKIHKNFEHLEQRVGALQK